MAKKKTCVGEVMGRFKRKNLHSGKKGPLVKNRQQAIAIALNICDNSESCGSGGCECDSCSGKKKKTVNFSCQGGCGGTCGCPSCKDAQAFKEKLVAEGWSEIAVDATLFGEAEEKRKKWGSIYKKGLSEKDQKSAAKASERAEKAEKEGKSKDEVYKPWPSDKKTQAKLKKSGKKMPKSKATLAYEKKFGKADHSEKSEMNFSEALKEKAKKSGIPLGILRSVYAKGVGAWKTGHRPGTTPQQWGMARVNSFITGSGKARKADADLWKKAKAAKAKK